ncbi:HAD-IA family hydrolase [Microbacterium sp. KSW2-29]|uniref:HAD-IA family hydrolase n=1 Tax=Microbacterium phycohabitans TaxID=3075993 RepID=A0ABU3SQ38_9MICO|nr:HAD-IA family hydrolase [Microbacterium sp. KSW2-29]MDU0346923.1 HAD-IA family hydrolase [Microbacterium sp. KSW2-29]
MTSMTPVTCYVYGGGMPSPCQIPEPLAVVVAGPAGSGKSTLGRALAAELRAPLVDLDSVTTPLLEALPADALGGHWLTSRHAGVIRAGRYAALRATAADALSTAGRVVVVAPFTAELTGGDDWQALRDALFPTEPVVLHVDGDPEILASRRVARGAARDAHRVDVPPVAPAVPVVAVDAELTTAQQLARALPALGIRRPLDAGAAIFAREFDAVLFDLDGTLVDSTASVARSWRRFAEHFDVSMEALHANHGQPARTLVSLLLPPDRHAEALAHVTDLEVTDAVGLAPIRGAAAFFASVPADRRAIVTSGSVPIATARLAAAGYDQPDVFVTVDDVVHGKPDPEPFLLAATRLGVDPSHCLVVEDAPAGIAAARAAGCAVIALTGTTADEELHADLVVDGLDAVGLEIMASGALRLVPAAD